MYSKAEILTCCYNCKAKFSYLKRFYISDCQDKAFGTKEKAVLSHIIDLVPVSTYSIEPVASLSSKLLFLQQLIGVHSDSILGYVCQLIHVKASCTVNYNQEVSLTICLDKDSLTFGRPLKFIQCQHLSVKHCRPVDFRVVALLSEHVALDTQEPICASRITDPIGH